jgi:hypothetical protein
MAEKKAKAQAGSRSKKPPARKTKGEREDIVRSFLLNATPEEIGDALLEVCGPGKAVEVVAVLVAKSPDEVRKRMAQLEGALDDDPARFAGGVLGGLIRSLAG